MIVVKEITKAGGACPFQVFGKTDKGEEVYARYRHGYLKVEINEQVVFAKQLGEDQDDEATLASYRQFGMSEENIEKMRESFKNMREFYSQHPEDNLILCFDGSMDLDELREATEGVIEWPSEMDNIDMDL